MDLTSSYIFSNSTLVEILDDLCVRFIINLPEEELISIERICFQIEEAQWYFEDFIRETNPTLPTLPLRAFLNKIFAVCPLPILKEMPPERAESAFAEFMAYKTRVPVRGAILLNNAMDKCVLVKGWKSGASWSFPRGKINKDERDEDCAAREVLEETGYDVEGRVHSDHFVEVTMREQNMRLYIIPGVPEETKFEPRTRKEISKIAWHYLSDLPTFSKKKNQQNIQQSDVRTGKYYMVAPFLRELRKWISISGKKWLEEQKQMPSSAALIGDETEIEEEASPLRVVDSSAELRNLLGIPHNRAAQSNGNYNTTGTGEATARLKNFLNLSGPATEPVDASSKLKSLLNVDGGNNTRITEQSLKPNPRALLSILQNGGGPSTPQPTVTPSRLPQPAGQHTPPAPASIHHPPLGSPNNIMEDFHSQIRPPHPPSPPPTSGFPGPRQLHNQPYNHPHPPNHRFPPPPQFSQPMFSLHQHGEFPSFLNRPLGQQPPPTPLDAFMPPPVPSKPPDPGQAVALLSILKSATPGPPATPHTPPPGRAANPSPIPFRPYHQQEQQTQQIDLQAPPTSKISKSQHKNNLLETLRASATETTRPAPTTPIAQYVAPSPRPMTSLASGNANTPARPVHSTVTTPQTNRFLSRAPSISRTPVPVSTTPQPTSFDRRHSVSNERQKALLAMFTESAASASTPHEDSAIMSSPEEARPTTPIRSRTTSFARRIIPRSPLSREKDGLLAYLETVAKEGGQ
ncbi:DCP2-domain-containing protein [Choiromyces venosus 120613-1]|uniref:DCP2-domain-containing protein n=1 Tax=Choiromyces venosus 120613-1 TaxID=1336337 RepID=A0A3N4JIU8_9PEZI|nr:DCP2-domain-containing protein [Choiromyces venosus 120613-1]